jgi:hypothetical protein
LWWRVLRYFWVLAWLLRTSVVPTIEWTEIFGSERMQLNAGQFRGMNFAFGVFGAIHQTGRHRKAPLARDLREDRVALITIDQGLEAPCRVDRALLAQVVVDPQGAQMILSSGCGELSTFLRQGR